MTTAAWIGIGLIVLIALGIAGMTFVRRANRAIDDY